MTNYFASIQTAILLFPLIAFLFTLPYILVQYHKYGSIPLLRSTIVYSFILYILCIYFLVILPLPPIEKVTQMTTPYMQWIPFHFIVDFIEHSCFVWNDVATYLPALKESYVYTVVFNLIMFIPLGIYLRYYFKCNWKTTVCISFFISLFFECTQLSGLYGIYPRPYRLFDVDDLIINTMGGMFGYWLTSFFLIFLPTRDALDQKSYEKGKRVGYIRRFVACSIDLWITLFLTGILSFLLSNDYKYAILLAVFMYFMLLPVITGGKTLGKAIVQIRIIQEDGTKARFYQYIIRYGILYFLILFAPVWIINLLKIMSGSSLKIQLLCGNGMIALIFIYGRFLFQWIQSIITKKNCFDYELMSHTKNESTIMVNNEKEKIPIEKEKNKRYNKKQMNTLNQDAEK